MADRAQRFTISEKQRAFVDQYMVDHNATQAAVRAGYSQKTANSQGSQLLRKPNVAHHIEARAQAAAEKSAMSAQEVLRRLTLMATFDLADIMTIGLDGIPRLKPMEIWSEAAKISVVAFKVDKTTGKCIECKLADKQAALVDLGRSHGLFKDVIDDRRDSDDDIRERLAKSEEELEAELRGGRPRIKAVS